MKPANLQEYMQQVRTGISNPDWKNEIRYDSEHRDMGYTSGLQYFGLEQTAETDALASLMIYGEKPTAPTKPEPPQMELLSQ